MTPPDNGASVTLTHRGAKAQIAPSGVNIQQTPGAHEPPYPRESIFLDLGDLGKIIRAGMADGGWADWFREEVRSTCWEGDGWVKPVLLHGDDVEAEPNA